MGLRHLVYAHVHDMPFGLAAIRLADKSAPISRFVEELERKPVWRTAEVRAFFSQAGPRRTGGYRHKELAQQVPQYGRFLDRNRFQPNREELADPSEFVHDAIGHIALGHPVTPLGEICACAGVVGFSSTVGLDYFINALLMFSLGYQLFDDVPPATVAITSEVGAVIEAAYLGGTTLAQTVGYTDRNKHDTLVFVIDRWSQILLQSGGGWDGKRAPP